MIIRRTRATGILTCTWQHTTRQRIMEDINAFNNLGTLSQANQVLQARLAVLGDRKDLHELRDIFERYDIASEVGLSLLHKHFTIEEGEMVVEFGHVSTPWPVPSNGKVAGGYVVPRSWRFMSGKLVPYEFGFNHPAQSEYKEYGLPTGFVEEVATFLSNTDLEDVLGICAIGNAELEGRIEMNRGRVNFTVPPSKPEDMDVKLVPEHSPSVWAFDWRRTAAAANGKEISPSPLEIFREYSVPISGMPSRLPIVEVADITAKMRPEKDRSTFDARKARRLTVAPDPRVIIQKPATNVERLDDTATTSDPTQRSAALQAEISKSRGNDSTPMAEDTNELVNGSRTKKTKDDTIALKEKMSPA
ncbi:hypothetical protein F5X97DRAFT_346526 [Nemania serpens]|nr:hypothetical protein F5X97DRAFT_346526 [Nemania serpens]